MSYEHCSKHGQDATNGCSGCLAEKQAACQHLTATCNECAVLVQLGGGAGEPQNAPTRHVEPFDTLAELLERLRLYRPDTLIYFGSPTGPISLQVATVRALLGVLERRDPDSYLDPLFVVRVISSAHLWP